MRGKASSRAARSCVRPASQENSTRHRQLLTLCKGMKLRLVNQHFNQIRIRQYDVVPARKLLTMPGDQQNADIGAGEKNDFLLHLRTELLQHLQQLFSVDFTKYDLFANPSTATGMLGIFGKTQDREFRAVPGCAPFASRSCNRALSPELVELRFCLSYSGQFNLRVVNRFRNP